MVLCLVRWALTHRIPKISLCLGNMETLLLLLNILANFQGTDKYPAPIEADSSRFAGWGRILRSSCWLPQKQMPAEHPMSSDIAVLCFGFKYLPIMAVSSSPSFLSHASQAVPPHHPTIQWADFISSHTWRNLKFGLRSLALNFVIMPLHQFLCCVDLLPG